MRKLVLLVWLLLPILAGAYHYGPGQDRLALDRVDSLLKAADSSAKSENWADAVALYEEALEGLPEDSADTKQRIRLERAKAMMFVKKLPTAHQEAKILVDELQADPSADAEVLNDARATLANSQYYMTWLMRLEGRPRSEWEPEIEAARQTYRLLAEQAEDDGNEESASRNREDLESTIRLARMDLKDLQGLPLPSQ